MLISVRGVAFSTLPLLGSFFCNVFSVHLSLCFVYHVSLFLLLFLSHFSRCPHFIRSSSLIFYICITWFVSFFPLFVLLYLSFFRSYLSLCYSSHFTSLHSFFALSFQCLSLISPFPHHRAFVFLSLLCFFIILSIHLVSHLCLHVFVLPVVLYSSYSLLCLSSSLVWCSFPLLLWSNNYVLLPLYVSLNFLFSLNVLKIYPLLSLPMFVIMILNIFPFLASINFSLVPLSS